ncbi:MAG TPA: erythromycin esterase family protein [Chitinophagaceae bacterium]|nr:erythromycin esterase family protein [Chitinophagaceae bacterium]
MKVIAKWLLIPGFIFFLFVSKQDSSAQIPWHPLEKDLDMLIKEIGKARIVLLGESTHGTHEFYEWRAAITKKLIEEKGFDLIAIEGDWVDSRKVDQFIKGPQQDSSSVIELLKQYDRWPSSMWGNYEMAGLVQWLNGYNQTRVSKNKIGFYGLDVYSFWEWTNQDIPVQDSLLQNALQQVRENFAGYNNDAMKYAEAVRKTNANYSASTQNLWSIVQKDIEQQPKDEARFVWQQQALLALQGERYFRTMVSDRVQSWDIRENYMAETIQRLLDFYGSHSKVIIWMHNGHAGDAHFSQMAEAGNTSVGEILKKQMGDHRTFSIGFGTNKGWVLAGYYWNAPLIKIEVPAARTGSWENILHESGPGNKIILSRELKNNKAMNRWIAIRSIGAANNTIYGTAIIPKRFDAFVYIDSTSAIRPVKNSP